MSSAYRIGTAASNMVTVLVDGDSDAPADFHIDAILELGPVIDAICAGGACEQQQDREQGKDAAKKGRHGTLR